MCFEFYQGLADISYFLNNYIGIHNATLFFKKLYSQKVSCKFIVSLLDFFIKRMKERKEEMCKNKFSAVILVLILVRLFFFKYY